MAKAKTKYGVFKGQLYYARVFKDNMDDSEFHEKTQGQYNVMFVPEDDKTLDYADGKKGMKLKRPNVHPSGYEGLGGAPEITKGATNVPWDFTKDGALGNGTTAMVKISIYGEGTTASVKLEKVGVLEHVPYEEGVGASSSW